MNQSINQCLSDSVCDRRWTVGEKMSWLDGAIVARRIYTRMKLSQVLIWSPTSRVTIQHIYLY